MATNSRARSRWRPSAIVAIPELARRIGTTLARASNGRARNVALLVVRIVEFEKIAWRDGKRAARRAERGVEKAFQWAATRALRGEDCIGHDAGSDIFVVAMLAAPREAIGPNALDCRATLERIARAIDGETSLPVETGWLLLTELRVEASLDWEIAAALERGARERERYEFFAAVGHELRTPLTSIRGYLETLLEEDLDGQTRRHFTETAQREATRLGRLIEGMLDFSLLDESAEALHQARCDLSEQITAACEAVAPLAQRNRVRVEYLPGTAMHVRLGADRCVQVVLNILDNALKYGRPGGVVRIETISDPPYVCVLVDDDGPGLSTDEYEYIFNARVRGSRSRGTGRGLGLAIVKSIVERAGGEVEAGPSLLGGARFEVWLPAAHAGPGAETIEAVS